MRTLLVILLISTICYTQRVTNSPYPFSNQPTHLSVVSFQSMTPDEKLLLQSLQGMLARSTPRLFRIDPASQQVFLNDIVENYNVTVSTANQNNLQGILSEFRESIQGYFLCDAVKNTHSIIAAIDMASVLPGHVVATAATKAMLDKMSIPMINDMSGLTEEWPLKAHGKDFNTRVVAIQDMSKFESDLADYSIFAGLFSFYGNLNPPNSVAKQAFSRLSSEPSALLGWYDGTDAEKVLVTLASESNTFVNAADWAPNLSVYTNFNLGPSIIQPGHSTIPSNVNVHNVAFLMTDGDNIQWLLNDFATDTKWYGSPQRGQANIGWTFSPAMAELAPTVMKYVYKNAANKSTGKDFFVASASGVGYMYPDSYSESNLTSYATLTAEMMKKSDMKILNVLGSNPDSKYLSPLLEQDQIDAIIYYYYADYSGLQGKISWVNNKPVIGGRYNLWKGFETPQTLAKKLNALPRDVTNADSYSLIPVHVWTMSVADIITCIGLLDNSVNVVTPEELVGRIIRDVRRN